MKTKHNYLSGITRWSNENQTENGWIVWYRTGGKVRGDLNYRIFDTMAEAESFAETMKK